MLNYIHLENFRAFGQPTTIPLAPITLLFGENSAGKTSVLHALSLLKQSADNEDPEAVLVVRDPGGLVDLGSFEELIFDHDIKRTLRIGLGWNEPLRRLRFHRLPKSKERLQAKPQLAIAEESAGREVCFRYSKTAGISRDSIAICDGLLAQPLVRLRPYHESTANQSTDHDHGRLPLLPGESSFRLRGSDLAPAEFELARSLLFNYRDAFWTAISAVKPSRIGLRVTEGRFKRLLDLLSEVIECMRRSIDADEALTNLLEEIWRGVFRGRGARTLGVGPFDITDLLTATLGGVDLQQARRELSQSKALCPDEQISKNEYGWREVLSRLSPIGPFRQPASRLYTHTGVNPRGVGRQGELVADMLRMSASTLERTNDWLKAFGIHHRVKLRALGRRSDFYEVRLRDTRRGGGLDVAFTDVGFGISQVLPIVVQCVATRHNIITIEQPEVHIHPRLQAEIGDLLVDCVRRNGHQFIVETHSEHLILRLRRLVREGKVKPAEISVIYVDRGRHGSTAQRIGINPDGTFEREWPGGFFPERMRELL